MNEKELFDRLPLKLLEYDELGPFEFTKDDGGYLLHTENRYGEIELPWSAWVAFAEKIIEADKAAREASLQENDPDNPFVQFAIANWGRYSAAADLEIMLKRGLSENVISWEQAEAACGVEGIVVYDLMHGRVDGFDVDRIREMTAAVERAAAAGRKA